MQSGRGARTYWVDGRGLPGCKVEMGQLDGMGYGQEDGTEEGTAGTQAGGWLSFYRGSSVLLYVRVCVNVKRGEGRQAGRQGRTQASLQVGPCQLLGACRLAVWSSGRHYTHTVTLIPPSSALCIPPQLHLLPAAPPSPRQSRQSGQSSPGYKLGYLVSEGHCRPVGVMELGWRGTCTCPCGPPGPAWASLLSPGAIVSCWEAAALALILSIRP